jgi:membrane-bound metal-dependent hydrolase YbcI (DUF457 family)
VTNVAHTLTGIAIGVACMPSQKPKKWKAVYLCLCALLANFPDLQLPFWGHGAYYRVSHSLFVNLALLCLLVLPFIVSKKLRAEAGGAWVVAGCALAWTSHLLLDTFYNVKKGLMIFWPLSEARVSLAMPWFNVVTEYFSLRTLRIVLVEIAFYGGLLLLVVLVRRVILSRKPSPEKLVSQQ